MKHIIKKLTIATSGIMAAVGLVAGPVLAQSGSQMYQANLQALNDSGASGTAMVEMVGENRVKVTLNTTGSSAELPHAQHLHIGGNNTCPDPSADGNDDDLISTAEGQPSYGEVRVSLTTEGATNADSALAVDRFPVASADGNIEYSRTFDLPEGVSMDDLSSAVVVQHGVSELFGNESEYDGDKKSSLDDSLPLEATIPASCGVLSSTATGGVATGTGETAGIDNAEYAVAGTVLVGLAALLFVKRYSKLNS